MNAAVDSVQHAMPARAVATAFPVSSDLLNDPVVLQILQSLEVMDASQRELVLKTVRTLNVGRH